MLTKTRLPEIHDRAWRFTWEPEGDERRMHVMWDESEEDEIDALNRLLQGLVRELRR